ncbi:hypothetical protein AWB74_08256 [Caballeronia arvi]|uniref:Uncharacterized protein n=1 Tax=Caballeronia arvi TaxID=1777135 RepID=A0A158L427_9BURK|nr:hypothetical protein AWB74_08256 [Caballeronia arvi]
MKIFFTRFLGPRTAEKRSGMLRRDGFRKRLIGDAALGTPRARFHVTGGLSTTWIFAVGYISAAILSAPFLSATIVTKTPCGPLSGTSTRHPACSSGCTVKASGPQTPCPPQPACVRSCPLSTASPMRRHVRKSPAPCRSHRHWRNGKFAHRRRRPLAGVQLRTTNTNGGRIVLAASRWFNHRARPSSFLRLRA